jgi:hypothetical protein
VIPFQPFEELFQSFLVRGNRSNEPHPYLAPAIPTHRRLFDADWRFVAWNVKAKGQLDTGVDLAIGLDAAATLRQVDDRPDRFAEVWTGEQAVKVHRKTLVTAEVHESLPLSLVDELRRELPLK